MLSFERQTLMVNKVTVSPFFLRNSASCRSTTDVLSVFFLSLFMNSVPFLFFFLFVCACTVVVFDHGCEAFTLMNMSLKLNSSTFDHYF